ncbi:MAG: bifunctional aspartate kinase/homoserine dehydrogenase I [Chitinophagaceae bacterium]|nr:bifunctional aspartate kinase/homoserine dehydrogenase I [Chitinophagaceae bacterium]MBL0200601.1 bifunctional aspartate kinase/homoserine dehydrogenase I [Chitinophagaceae bacterium]
MQVLKFGGSSVANAENINKVVEIIKNKKADVKTVVVVSALGGITDLLLKTAALAEANDESYKAVLKEIEDKHLGTVQELIPVQQQSSVLSLVKKICNEAEDICNGIFLLRELSARTKDRIVSYGELLSSQIIAAKLNAVGLPAEWKDAREIIMTDSNYGIAAVDFVATDKKAAAFFKESASSLFIIPGFIAADKNNVTTTLGRGGSDYTAAILAAAVNAAVLEIWTDVSGMMTADPRLVNNIKHIPQISYQEAMELSHFGAKVIYPPTIQPVMKKGIPVWIKNTFAPEEPGTVIKNEATATGTSIQGISSINSIVLLSLEGSGMVGIPGFSKRLFEALANASINVILITQGSSEHSICVGVDEYASAKAKEVIDAAFAYEIETNKVDPIIVEKELSIVAIVGDNMKNHSGISGKMFSALGRNGVSIRAIAQGSSERNISAVISTADVKKAINVLHEEFFETTYKQVNLFIGGLGNVGQKFLDQLQQQKQFLLEKLRIQIRVAGIANSKKMYFNEDGIDIANWQTELQKGEAMNLADFVSTIQIKNLRNSVFADITANEELATVYGDLLQKSISVVACNKVAASSPYLYYKKLKDLANEFNSQFLFETNVGAGLPIIGTLKDLLHSGDKINRIQAVLSGTLNFVFNNYDGTTSFASVVKQAQDEGYTEPDPRLDLSGKDVMRKIMILARESGEQMEMEDISNNSFMPESCMTGSVEDFYAAMEKEETHFKKILDAAKAAGKKLKFVASYDKGKAAVGLQQVDEQSDFYHLYGKDNVVLFYTDRYSEQPLVVKGAGAGAAVTASGVFADIIRAAAN